MSEILPMFPLGTALLPYTGLPLRVFELRYLELIHDCIEGEPEFGVALIERGHEVGGGDARFDVGCVARILEVEESDIGRLHVLTLGVRRVRVTRWLPDAPYPKAEVEDWPDPDLDAVDRAMLAEPLEELTALTRRVLGLAAEMGARVARATASFHDDPLVASYQLSRAAPISEMDRLELLCAPSVGRRLERLGEMLRDVEAIYAGGLGT